MLRTALVALALFVAPCAVAVDVEPGRWELTVTTYMQGAKAPLGPSSHTQCISAEDAKDPGRILGEGVGCQFANRRDSGSEYSFDVSCKGLLPMTGSGRMRYRADSFEGDLDLGTDIGGGQKFSMRSHVVGRRLGPCTK